MARSPPRYVVGAPSRMTEPSLPRGYGDIQTAVVALIDRLAPAVPVPDQPETARKIAKVLASRPSTMAHAMFVRQSIIRAGTATNDHVAAGLATWATVLFDIGNLRHDRARALEFNAHIPDDALTRALARSRNGCILAVPHLGCIELLLAHLKDRGFAIGCVFTMGDPPTPTEQWLFEGRTASHAIPIQFGQRDTGAKIDTILRDNGVVLMAVDVYPSDRYQGIPVEVFGATFPFPPGPARYARSGTLVLPGFVSGRNTNGISANILDPIEFHPTDFTQKLAGRIAGFIAEHPEAYWLWHPIPNDPFLALARQQRQDLLHLSPANDEAVALEIEAFGSAL